MINNVRYRRNVLLANMFFGYFMYCIARKSCTYSIAHLLGYKSLLLSAEDFGVISSTQMIFYTLGKIYFGILSDRKNPALIFACGLFSCGFANILFSMCSSTFGFSACWAMNGFFQGCGWAPITVLVTRWYSKCEAGTIWAILSTSINASYSIIPFVMTSLLNTFDWEISFKLVGGSLCFFSCFVYALMTDHPQHIVSSVETIHQHASKSKKIEQHTKNNFRKIFRSRYLWMVSISYLFWTFVKSGLEDWLHVYLIKEKLATNYQASTGVMFFQLGGFVACIFSGVISDKLVQVNKYATESPRVPVVVFCSIFIQTWIFALHFLTIKSKVLLQSTCFFLGLCCYGPHTLFGLLALEHAPTELSATAHALTSSASTVGGVMAYYPLSCLVGHYGWSLALVAIAITCVVVTCILLMLGSKEILKKEK